MNPPLTPQQALNNFALLKEMEDVSEIHELAFYCLSVGIQGDDAHPLPDQPAITEMASLLRDCLAYIQAGIPDLPDESPEPGTQDETITTSTDDGPEFTVNLTAIRRILVHAEPCLTTGG
jgi:hypothetical protein